MGRPRPWCQVACSDASCITGGESRETAEGETAEGESSSAEDEESRASGDADVCRTPSVEDDDGLLHCFEPNAQGGHATDRRFSRLRTAPSPSDLGDPSSSKSSTTRFPKLNLVVADDLSPPLAMLDLFAATPSLQLASLRLAPPVMQIAVR